MSFCRCLSLFVLGWIALAAPLHASIQVSNVSAYHFGLVRVGAPALKESTLWISANHYKVTVSGAHDQNYSFHLAYGFYQVEYAIYWKDQSGNSVQLLPNTSSPIFGGALLEQGNALEGPKQPAQMSLRLTSPFPHPGHYKDTLTLIISPA